MTAGREKTVNTWKETYDFPPFVYKTGLFNRLVVYIGVKRIAFFLRRNPVDLKSQAIKKNAASICDTLQTQNLFSGMKLLKWGWDNARAASL